MLFREAYNITESATARLQLRLDRVYDDVIVRPHGVDQGCCRRSSRPQQLIRYLHQQYGAMGLNGAPTAGKHKMLSTFNVYLDEGRPQPMLLYDLIDGDGGDIFGVHRTARG